MCAFPDSTMIQCNPVCIFLDLYMETKDNVPQILKETVPVKGWPLWNPKCIFQRGQRSDCTVSLRTDKDMGNYWARFWLIDWWGAREVLGFVGEQSSEQESSQPSPSDWNLINKNLFPSILTVESCIKVPCASALVCLVAVAPVCIPTNSAVGFPFLHFL